MRVITITFLRNSGVGDVVERLRSQTGLIILMCRGVGGDLGEQYRWTEEKRTKS